ncbi:MAG: TerD family protein [Verrucomicrobia bacterium]|nr:TerD family protein [Verrucomicrobiota bacterium]
MENNVINLKKGQKVTVGFYDMTVGLGWDPNPGTGYDFDLDVSAMMVDKNRRLPSADFFIFYNNLCGNGHDTDNCTCEVGQYGVRHTGDDPTGGVSDHGDDEAIKVDLNKVPADIEEIIFVVTINDAKIRNNQNFGQVKNAYIRLVDNNTNQEVMKYELDEDFSIETGVEFGRLYKRNSEWKFDAIGVGEEKELDFFVDKYFNGTIVK